MNKLLLRYYFINVILLSFLAAAEPITFTVTITENSTVRFNDSLNDVTIPAVTNSTQTITWNTSLITQCTNTSIEGFTFNYINQTCNTQAIETRLNALNCSNTVEIREIMNERLNTKLSEQQDFIINQLTPFSDYAAKFESCNRDLNNCSNLLLITQVNTSRFDSEILTARLDAQLAQEDGEEKMYLIFMLLVIVVVLLFLLLGGLDAIRGRIGRTSTYG